MQGFETSWSLWTCFSSSDREPAVVSFLQEVATRRGALGTVVEHFPVDESQANGRAERAVITFEELLRVRKFSLECRIGEKVSVQHNNSRG